MKEPKDINDYSLCIRYFDGALRVFCVECNNWRKIAIACEAKVHYRDGLILGKISNCHNLRYLCNHCEGDIEYLLNDSHKRNLIKSMDIPIGDYANEF